MGYRGFIEHDGNHAPKPPFQLNKDSPQADGLIGFWPDTAMRNPINVVDGGRSTSGSALGVAASRHGSLAASNVSVGVNKLIVTDKDYLGGLNTFTLMAWVWKNSVATDNQSIFSAWDTAATKAQILWRREITSNDFELFLSASGTGSTSAFAAPAAFGVSVLHFAAVRVTPFFQFWLDGVQVASSDPSWGVNTIHANADNVAIGGGRNASDIAWCGEIWWPRIYNYAVPNSIMEAAYNPRTRWDLTAEQPRINYFVPAAAAGGAGLPAGSLASMGVGI